MDQNTADTELFSQSSQCQGDQGKRKDRVRLKGIYIKNQLDVVLQVGHKKLLQVSKPGGIIDNDQEIKYV